MCYKYLHFSGAVSKKNIIHLAPKVLGVNPGIRDQDFDPGRPKSLIGNSSIPCKNPVDDITQYNKMKVPRQLKIMNAP